MGLSQKARSALENAYDKYADTLYRIALTHTGRREDAEDAVHDVFLRFVDKEPVFADSNHEEAWFIRVTINRCIDITRRDKRRSYQPLDESIGIHAPEEDMLEPQILGEVSALPPKYKSVIILHCLEDKPVSEVALALGISPSAVKMRLVRGRELLKKSLDPGKEGTRHV